jgi:hypothetical protein
MSPLKIILTVILLVMLSGYATYGLFNLFTAKPKEEVKPVKTYVELPSLVTVSDPVKNSVIGDMLDLKGEARGYWYFEGQFPVSVIDDTGYIVAQGTAKALGDWKTTSMVPFESHIDVTSSARSETGIIKIIRDEQKGSNAQYVEVPVRFKNFTITEE